MYELPFLLSRVLSVVRNLSCKLQRRSSDVLPIHQGHVNHLKKKSSIGGLRESKLFDTLQAITPTNVKKVNQTPLLHCESNLYRPSIWIVVTFLRPAFSATKIQSGQFALQYVLINKPKSFKVTLHTEVHGGGGLELVKPARESASSSPKPSIFFKNAQGILPVHRSLLAIVGRKQTVVGDELFPQKPPDSRL